MLEYSMKSTSNSKVGDVTSFLVLHSPLDVQINLQINFFFLNLAGNSNGKSNIYHIKIIQSLFTYSCTYINSGV